MTPLLLFFAAVAAAVLALRYQNPHRFVSWLLRAIRRSMGFRTGTVDVDGVTWPYLEGGPATAEVVLLLHGFGGDKDNWPLYARCLAREYRVYVPDLPGFGANAKNPDADYSTTAQARRLLRFLDVLGCERAHVGGNSMGGLIALRLALMAPERVASLALLNNAGVRGSKRSELELAAERGESPLTVSTREEFEQLLSFVTHRRVPLPGVVRQVLSDFAIAQHDFWDTIFWGLFEEISNAPLNDELVAIRAPTLIIWGRHDRLIDVSCCEVLKGGIADSECVIFEDIGHLPMLERPRASSAAHLAHLRRVSAN